MALNQDKLAKVLSNSLSDTADSAGKKKITDTLKSLSLAIITGLKSTTFAHPLVIGMGAPTNHPAAPPNPGEFTEGAALTGVIVPPNADLVTGIFFPSLATTLDPLLWSSAYGETKKYIEIVCNYFAAGLVVFSANKVTGTCTAVAPQGGNPGVAGTLVDGAAAGGKLVGLNGEILSTLVSALLVMFPNTEENTKFHVALIQYIVENIELTYPSGSVTGTFQGLPYPIPLTAGVGLGGVIS